MGKKANLSLPKRRQNAEAILKADELHIYGDMHYIMNSFCYNVQKTPVPQSVL